MPLWTVEADMFGLSAIFFENVCNNSRNTEAMSTRLKTL